MFLLYGRSGPSGRDRDRVPKYPKNLGSEGETSRGGGQGQTPRVRRPTRLPGSLDGRLQSTFRPGASVLGVLVPGMGGGDRR